MALLLLSPSRQPLNGRLSPSCLPHAAPLPQGPGPSSAWRGPRALSPSSPTLGLFRPGVRWWAKHCRQSCPLGDRACSPLKIWPPHPVPRPPVSHTLIRHAGPGVSCGSGWPQDPGKAPLLGSGSASAQGSRKLWAALHRHRVAPTPAHPTQTLPDPGQE